MTVLISQYTVYLFGVVIVALSVWGVVVPNRLIALVTGSMNRGSGLYVRIGSRVVLGVALIVAAPPARFPILFAVLGWISIAAAIALPLFGRARLGALLGWLERMPTTLVRLWVFVYRVEARKSAKWCAGLVRMCRYVQYGSRGRQTGRFEGARARG